MNILFVTTQSIYNSSSSNIRNVSLLQGIHSLGHNITVVSVSSKKQKDKTIAEMLEKICTIYEVGNTNSISDINDGRLSAEKRLANYAKPILVKMYEYVRIYDQYKGKIKLVKNTSFPLYGTDLVISSSDPRSSHLFAEEIMKNYSISAPWVQYWGDPMSCDVTSKSLLKFLLKREEKKLYAKASYIFFTNILIEKYMKERYSQYSNKMHHIHTSFFKPAINCTSVESKAKKDEYLIGYYGDYNSINRNIIPLCHAVDKLADASLTIVGDGDFNSQEVPSGRILIYKRLPYEKVQELQANTDLLIVIENKRNRLNICTQVPGKLYHYALSNKPVLIICEGDELEAIFEKFNRFYFCKNEESSIMEVLDKIIKNEISIEKIPIEDFLPEVVAGHFINIIMKGTSN